MHPNKEAMNVSWEEIVRELEEECLKTKDALEDAWEEIDRLQEVNEKQEKEIAALVDRLAQFESLCESATNSTALTILDEVLGGIKSERISCFQRNDVAEWVTSENVPQPFTFGCNRTEETFEKLPFKTRSRFLDINTLPSSSSNEKEGSLELQSLQAQVEERDGRILCLESELDKAKNAMIVALEDKHRELEKVKSDNLYREERMMSLQSQLAAYMLKEATSTSQRNLAIASNSRSLNFVGPRESHVVGTFPEVNDEDGIEDDSWNFRDPRYDSCGLASSCKGRSSLKTFRMHSMIDLCRPFPKMLSRSPSQRDIEEDLLRQLDFVQAEKRMDLRELQNRIEDRDAVIKRYQRTITSQEEKIQNLQHLIEANIELRLS